MANRLDFRSDIQKASHWDFRLESQTAMRLGADLANLTAKRSDSRWVTHWAQNLESSKGHCWEPYSDFLKEMSWEYC